MIPIDDPWVPIVLLYPLFSLGYGRIVAKAIAATGRNPAAGRYTALVPATAIAVGVLLTRDVPLSLDATYLVFLPGGMLLYGLETRILDRVVARPLATPAVDSRWLLPVVPGAIIEEIVFRAALAPLLRVDDLLYIAVSALAFGALHLPHTREAALKCIDGALYAFLYVSSGMLLPSILAHVGFNLEYARRASTHSIRPTRSQGARP